MNAPNQLSFLPEDYLEQKARRRASYLCGALAFVVLIAIGCAFWITESANRQVDRQFQAVDAEYAQAGIRINQAQALREHQRLIVAHAELAASLLEKVPRSNLMAEVTNALPAQVSLMDLSLETKSRQEAPKTKPPTAFAAQKAARRAKAAPPVMVEETTIRLSGVAATDEQVAMYMRRLEQSPLLRDVNLVLTDAFQQGDHTLRRFEIDMLVDPAARLNDQLANRVSAVDFGPTDPATDQAAVQP